MVFRRLVEIFAFFRAYFFQIAALLVGLALPLLLFGTLWEAEMLSGEQVAAGAFLPYVLVYLLYQPIYQAPFILFLTHTEEGSPFPPRDWLASGLPHYPRLLVVHLLRQGAIYTLLMVAVVGITPIVVLFNQSPGLFKIPTGLLLAAGVLFVIAAGLFVAARLSFAQFIAVLEQKSPTEALSLSWQRTKPAAPQLMAGMFLLFIPIGGLFLLASSASKPTDPGAAILSAIFSAVFLVLTGLYTILYYRFYGLGNAGAKTPDDSPNETPGTGD